MFVFAFTTSNNGNSSAGTITFDTWATSFAIAEATLPVSFLSLEAKKVTNGTQLTWKVAQEKVVVSYDVERSADGKNFSKLASVASTGATSNSVLDNSLSANTVYYRVRNNNQDGKYKYSTTIKVENGKDLF